MSASALVNVYKRLPLQIVRGAGSFVYDAEGRAYLDMYGGHAVAATGHGHPKLVAALKGQLERLLFYSNLTALEHQEEAARLLVDALPRPLDRAFFVNSGTEAVENALKVARKVTGRSLVLGFEGGFHGRTLGALSATGLTKYRAGAGLEIPGYAFAPFGDLAAVERLLAAQPFAAVIVEPVQSLAGVRMAPAGFFRGLKSLCEQHGALLIYDELQTGGGRAGGTYAFAPRHGVVPDLMTLGKGIASGVPMGVCVMTGQLAAALGPGDLGTTFGGGPFAALALRTTLEILAEDGLLARVAEGGDRLTTALAALPGVQEVTGVGYLLGLRLERPAAAVQGALVQAGVLTGTSEDPHVLRLMPPLTLGSDEIALFLDRLSGVLA